LILGILKLVVDVRMWGFVLGSRVGWHCELDLMIGAVDVERAES